MREDLEDEIEAINSIYGEGTIRAIDTEHVLQLPNQELSVKIQFPKDYPDATPVVLGTHSSGEHTKKGDAAHLMEVLRQSISRIWSPGLVCMYDVIEEVKTAFEPSEERQEIPLKEHSPEEQPIGNDLLSEAPPWTVSETVIEMRSVFIAHCAPVDSPEQAKQYLQHLLDSDKRIAKATHNITAHRIRRDDGVTYQDCDDDGETAAGGRVLHLMQLMDLWNVMVVVTRWYGGQKLGPARFGIINTVARDAFVKAGLVTTEHASGRKARR